jgi:hypothetical protein
MTMADRPTLVSLPSLFVYVTQTVPSGKLTQGKGGIGIGMVGCCDASIQTLSTRH